MTLEIAELTIPEVKLIRPRVFEDDRGSFSETYNKRDLAELGIDLEFVQDNHARSARRGTVRGLHFQAPPKATAKLVRVLRGRIFDVAVDIRADSPTYGQHVTVELSENGGDQVLVPVGFAHGYCTMEPETEVAYKVTEYWAPEVDVGILWNDPTLNIEWPVSADEAIVSDRDRRLPSLAEVGATYFN